MNLLEEYEVVAEDAHQILERMFSDAYRKRETRSILKHSAAGATIGGAIGAIPGGVAAGPGALVGGAAGFMMGKYKAKNRRIRNVARFAHKRKAKFTDFEG